MFISFLRFWYYVITFAYIVYRYIKYRVKKLFHKKENFSQIQHKRHFKILSKEKSLKILNDQQFFNSFTKYDWKARMNSCGISEIQEYSNVIKDSLVPINEISFDNLMHLNDSCKQVDELINNHSFNYDKWFNPTEFNNIPWKFIFVNGKYEDNLPHTRKDVIILPIDELSRIKNDLIELLIHEKIHIYQRKYADEMHTYLLKNGYEVIPGHQLKRANPDINEYTYKRNNKIFSCDYVSKNPQNISDVFYVGGDYTQLNEHPFEALAILFAKKVTLKLN